MITNEENQSAVGLGKADPNGYDRRMSSSISDKITWINLIPDSDYTTVLDFGCADGSVLKTLEEYIPDKTLVGYDIDPQYVKKASGNVPKGKFFAHWEDAIKECKPKETVLLVTGVIHEVYSYQTEECIELFWKRVFESEFKYVVVRDWLIQDKWFSMPVMESLKERIGTKYFTRFQSFTKRWGAVKRYSDLIHYLLKFNFTQNWTRENNEYYLPISLEQFLSKVPTSYVEMYSEQYVLPYTRQLIRTEFDYDPEFRTHYKGIFRMK